MDVAQQEHSHVAFRHFRVWAECTGVILDCDMWKCWYAFCVRASVLKENILTAVSVLLLLSATVDKSIHVVS